MTLLMGTDLTSEVNVRIRGRVARVGGTVDQLLRYEQCEVEDINIPDGGFGEVRPPSTSSEWFKHWRRYLRQEVRFLVRGKRAPRDRKTHVVDIHEIRGLRPDLRARFDSVISSNVLEHSPNPILFLLNLAWLCREDGWQFHAVPHYKYTYDRYRKPTPLEHLIADFESNTGFDDYTHTADYARSAIELDGWQREFHSKRPLTYPFIHFHVFDETTTLSLFQYMFESATVDVLKTNRFSDCVVLAPVRLNQTFVKTHRASIRKYLSA